MTTMTLRRPARGQPRVRSDQRHPGFDGIAHAGVAVVTCMDSRIDPLGMLGLKPGDAKIFRNPGRVTGNALGRSSWPCTCSTSTGSSSSRTPGVPWRRALSRSSATGSRPRPAPARRGRASTSCGTSTKPCVRTSPPRPVTPLISGRADVGGFVYDVDTGLLATLD